TLTADGKTTLSYALTGGQGFGIGKIRLKVSGGGFEVNRSFEIPVRAAWGSVARSRLQTLEPGESLALGTDIGDGLLPDTVVARVNVSALPPIPFATVLE